MKRHFIKKYIFSVLFLLLLFGFSAVNFAHTLPFLKAYLEKREWSDGSEMIKGLEKTIDEQVVRRYAFVEFYGFGEKVLGSNVDNGFDYVRTKDGELQYSNLNDWQTDTKGIFERTLRLKTEAEESGAKFLWMLVPQKYIDGESEFAVGLPYSDRTKELDEFVRLSKEKNVCCLDTRQYFEEIMEKTGKSVFFHTDHHWRPEAGFAAAAHLAEEMQKTWGKDLNPDGFYTNPENYDILELPESFLGSMGRQAGVVYAGMDDFTMITPAFETDFLRRFRVYAGGEWQQAEGPAIQSLFSPGNVSYDGPVYEGDMYGFYLNGVNAEDCITNRRNPDGPRVLVIRDSFFSTSACFLANQCSRLDLIWSINYDGDIRTRMEKGDYDYVILQLSALNMNNERFLDLWKKSY